MAMYSTTSVVYQLQPEFRSQHTTECISECYLARALLREEGLLVHKGDVGVLDDPGAGSR
jgi:hypothetical protein